MDRNISTKYAINHNIALLHNKLQASYDNDINDKNCYQKADNFPAQRSNDNVYTPLAHKDNEIVQTIDQSNEGEDYFQAIDQLDNEDKDYLQVIEQLDKEDKDYLQVIAQLDNEDTEILPSIDQGSANKNSLHIIDRSNKVKGSLQVIEQHKEDEEYLPVIGAGDENNDYLQFFDNESLQGFQATSQEPTKNCGIEVINNNFAYYFY